ncbi:MAG: S8 family serine peptidase [Candidatus Moranbacteria bacterium]|jgi:subtilisin family serine protease|nr:S8 family serine peptidase [Candidatus Moranbacteria bacterium]
MKKTSWLFVVLFISINLLVISEAKSSEKNLPPIPLEKKSFQEKKDKNYQEGEIIVQYKSKDKRKTALTKIKNLTDKKDLALEVKGEIDDLNIALIKSSTKSTAELIEEFKTDATVEFSEPNYKRELAFTPNDPYYNLEWPLNNTGQAVAGISGTADADIDAAEAWDIESDVATPTIVAVIDNGFQYNHPDLINNMWDGTVCVDDLGIPIPGGCPNHGWEYAVYYNDNDPYLNDPLLDEEAWHGTFIAGLIAGENNNSEGISGLSRYNHIKVMALKFDLSVFAELEAINFAKNNGAKVINASFIGTNLSLSEKNLIESFNGIFVAAAGNNSNDNDTNPRYPCSYTSTNIICVASSSQNDTLSSFSSYGSVSVDIMAPGENMVGTCEEYCIGGAGTSFAAPLVAGTAAMLYSHRPTASTTAIRETLLKSSDHFTAYADSISCGRRLNTRTSLQSIINNTIPTETCVQKLPVYRFWSDQNQGHFYTTNEDEKNNVINNYDDYIWRYEGVAFTSISIGKPVYRFWSDKNQHHFYTVSEEEKNTVINNYDDYIWRYEGVAYYLPETSAKPVYRFWSDKNQSHFYTVSEEEKNTVINNYDDYIWRYEGVAFYAY